MNSTVENQNFVADSLKHTFFSWSAQGSLKPLDIERTEGVYLYTRDGRRMLDFSSQLMNVNIGHGNPKVRDAVFKQMSEVAFVAPSMVTEVRAKLGKRLASIAPRDLNKTLFTLGGAEANENAIKIARLYTGRHKIIAQYRSYHGATYGAMSASGDPRKLPIDVQAAPSFFHFENPYAYRCPWGTSTPEDCAVKCIEHLERIINYQGPGNVAALMLEGESGTSGAIKYPSNYWPLLRSLADKYDLLLISDEVMSGFGRTGNWFAVQNSGVQPDIITCAKGMTSGYLPLGAMIVHDKIANHFNDRVLPLGLTYSAHATSCAAAMAVLDVFEEENLLARAREMGAYIDQKMEVLKEKHPSIGDWRNTGMMGGLELVKNRETKEPMAPWNAKPSEMAVMNKVRSKIMELGMFTFVKWNVVYVMPPLTITKEQIDDGIEILSQAIAIADKYCH